MTIHQIKLLSARATSDAEDMDAEDTDSADASQIRSSYFPPEFVHEGDGEEKARNGGCRRQEAVDEHFRRRIARRRPCN